MTSTTTTTAVWPAAKEMEKSESIQESIRLLGRVSVIKFKLLFDAVATACRLHENPLIDAASKDKIAKYNDSSIFTDSTQFWCCVISLIHIYSSAVKDAVSPTDLDLHMQQLGLPREHAAKLAQVHSTHFDDARAIYRRRLPSLPCPVDVAGHVEDGVAHVNMTMDNGDVEKLVMSKDTLKKIIDDLQSAEDHLTKLGVKSVSLSE